MLTSSFISLLKQDCKGRLALLTCPRHVGRKRFALPGLQGCPLLHLLSSRAAAGGAQKKKKEFCGDTPHPGRDAALPAPSLLRIFETKIRDDSC